MERALTPAERKFLEGVLNDLPPDGRRRKGTLRTAFVMFGGIVIFGWLGYGLLSVVVDQIFDWRIGYSSDVAGRVLLGLVAVALVYAPISTLRRSSLQGNMRQRIREDLEAGTVSEQKLAFTEAKVFQEPEHGGLIYFLKSDDEKVFVLYDRESLDLALAGEDPFRSSLKPTSTLTVVRVPRSGVVISTTVAGDKLGVSGPSELTASPDDWPENEEFCAIHWDQLEERLSG